MKTSTQTPHQLTSNEGDAVLLERMTLTGDLQGYALRLTLTQHYRNDSEHGIEAVYTFPVAAGATLAGLEAVIAGKRLVGQVMPRTEAETRYEKAIDEGDLPVMVERSGRGLYTANLGGIAGGEAVQIAITYVQLLDQEDGRIRLSVPTTVGSRYGDPRGDGGLQPHQTTHTDITVEHALEVDLRVGGLMAAATIESPSHAICQTREEGGVRITLAERAWLDRDFVLVLGDLPQQPQAIRCPDPASPDGQKSMVLASFTPNWSSRSSRAVDLKLLVDCSGSMAGDSIEQARQALSAIAAELGAGDRVSCSRFGSEVEHLIQGLHPATDEVLRARLSRAIRHLEADMGGTQMAKAIAQVVGLSQDRVESSPVDILLITDGSIWNVEGVIRTCLHSGHRVHAIGVGASPAESLLQAICQGTGGHCEMVTPGEDLAPAVMRVFKRVRAGQPISVEMDWDVEPLWQSALPQVAFSGQTLHLMALLPQQASGTAGAPVRLRWCVGDEAHSDVIEVDESTTTELAKVGGAQRIAQAKDEADAVQLALEYQLVTEQTNLLLVHVRAEDEKTDRALVMQRIAQMPAAGQFGVGTRLACMSVPGIHASGFAESISLSICDAHLPDAGRTNRSMSVDDMASFELPSFLRTGDAASQARDTSAPIDLVEAQALLDAFNRAVESEPDATLAFDSLWSDVVPVWIAGQIHDLTGVLGQRSQAIAVAMQWVANFVAAHVSEATIETLSRQALRSIRAALSSITELDVHAAMDRMDAAFEATAP